MTLCWILYQNIIIVPYNTVALVERFGKYKYKLQPGIHIKTPLDNLKTVKWSYVEEDHHIEGEPVIKWNVYKFIPSYLLTMDLPPISCMTKDNMEINIDCVLRYNITKPEAAVYDIQDPLSLMQDLFVSEIRKVCSSKEVVAISDKNNEFITLTETINDKLTNFGINCKSLTIQEIRLSDSIRKSKEETYIQMKKAEMLFSSQKQTHLAKIQHLDQEMTEKKLEETIKDQSLKNDLLRKQLTIQSENERIQQTNDLQLKKINSLFKLGFDNNQIVSIMASESWSDAIQKTQIKTFLTNSLPVNLNVK